MNEQNWRMVIVRIQNGYILSSDGPRCGSSQKYLPNLDNIKVDMETYIAELTEAEERYKKLYEAERASYVTAKLGLS